MERKSAMINGKSPSVRAELNIPTYLPLPKAAQKYGLSEKALTQLVQAGKIEAVRLPSGEVLVPADNGSKAPQTKEEIIATYTNADELKLCLEITRCIRSKETTAGEYIQVEI